MTFPRCTAVFLFSMALAACASAGHTQGDAPSTATAHEHQQQTEKAPQAIPVKASPAAVTKQSSPEGNGDDHQPSVLQEGGISIYFSFGGTKIDDQSKNLLRPQALRLKEDPRRVVTLSAFTDNLGSRSYNLAIAEERMASVIDALRALGVPMKQIRRKSAGLSKMSSSCNSEACRRQMRRVDLTYQ